MTEISSLGFQMSYDRWVVLEHK